MRLVGISLMLTTKTPANLHRLIVYYPVSALVTLFANILQNPHDARARSDIKLMNLVVTFLSMLTSDEENGSVRRMLGVCSEFERIAKVVLDRADKESSSRRKRKNYDDGTKAYQSPAPNTNTNRSPAEADTGGMFSAPGLNPQLNMQVWNPLASS
jgi:branched-subunit amino acid transport protein